MTLNDVPFNKQLRRRLGFVLQQDCFFSNLTLWETLYFTTMIRLPANEKYQYKISRLNEVIDILQLRGCLNTKIGDTLIGGLSGGEKKRASVACELLTDPDILLLDEPTTGLDTSMAHRLMNELQTLAKRSNKMIILTIHQPSSRIYNMFDALLLLARRNVLYFGDAHTTPLDFFRRSGYVCERYYNPAEFYLDILNSDVAVERIVGLHHSNRTDVIITKPEYINETRHGSVFTDSSIKCNQTRTEPSQDKWPTSFATQVKMLTWRNFKQSKASMMHIIDILQYAVVGAIAGGLFFQIHEKDDSIRDRLGLLYFVLFFWTFDSFHQAVFTMPTERAVISKERAAGTYRLSAYYTAKSVSELPLRLSIPSIFYSFIYWMAGLHGVAVFFMTLPVILLTVLNAQGFGLLLGNAVDNTKMAFFFGDTIILISMLSGGYITQTVPPWFAWTKYLSLIYYPSSALSIILFRDMDFIPCNVTSVSTFPQCTYNDTTYVTSSDMLVNAGVDIPLYCSMSTMVVVCVCLRLGVYIALRCRNAMPS